MITIHWISIQFRIKLPTNFFLSIQLGINLSIYPSKTVCSGGKETYQIHDHKQIWLGCVNDTVYLFIHTSDDGSTVDNFLCRLVIGRWKNIFILCVCCWKRNCINFHLLFLLFFIIESLFCSWDRKKRERESGGKKRIELIENWHVRIIGLIYFYNRIKHISMLLLVASKQIVRL